MEFSERIKALPRYLFAELDSKKQALREQGVDLIDLSVGDPDLPTPQGVVRKMAEEVAVPENHHYPDYDVCSASGRRWPDGTAGASGWPWTPAARSWPSSAPRRG